jgi:hypothetical protein
VAETDEYPSTPRWPLLHDFLALVIKHANTKLSEPAAKQLILDYYAGTAGAKRPYRGYSYQSVDTPHGRPGQGIDPRHWRGSAVAARWGSHVGVDWENDRVGWVSTAPSSGIEPGTRLEVLEHLQEYLPVDPVCEMRLVRLYAGDAFAILQWARLWEPPADVPAAPAAATQQGPAPRPAKKRPRRGIARWVYNYMEANPPREGDHEYVGNVHDLCPDAAEKKTIANLVSLYRKQFEIPAETSREALGKVGLR